MEQEEKELVSLQEILAFLKYEVDEADRNDPEIQKDINVIDSFRITAISYLHGATGKVFVTNPKAITYVKLFVNELFTGEIKTDPLSSKNLLLAQLRYCEEEL